MLLVVTLVNANIRAFATHCKKYVNKLFFISLFYHVDGIPGGKHPGILKQMQQAQSLHL